MSSAMLLAWISWRRHSPSQVCPAMLRGLLVVVCILALLFPVISISDDLSQMPGLAEGNRIQDILKAPELRGAYLVAVFLPTLLLALPPAHRVLSRSLAAAPISLHEFFWAPSIDKRPPPRIV